MEQKICPQMVDISLFPLDLIWTKLSKQIGHLIRTRLSPGLAGVDGPGESRISGGAAGLGESVRSMVSLLGLREWILVSGEDGALREKSSSKIRTASLIRASSSSDGT